MSNVLTPFGTRPSGDVILIPKGGQIVTDPRGTILLDGAGSPVHRGEPSDEPIEVDPKQWTAFATWENPSEFPIESFSTAFRVPPYPRRDNVPCQTLFIYNAAQPADKSSALMPVLQYGPSAAGGGNYWGVATWYITPKFVYHTCLTPVEIADPLLATIHLTHIKSLAGTQRNPPPPTYDYTARFKGIDETVVNVRASPELKWIDLIFEAHNAPSPDYYPPGVTLFYPTNVSLTPKLFWKIGGEKDSVKVAVDVNTARNGEIIFTY